MPRVSLYLDEDIRVLLGQVLRSRGYDVVHVLELGREGKSGLEQLDFSAGQGWAILTHNIKDYVKLAKSYEVPGKNHYGIIVSNHLPFAELLRRTLRLLSACSKEELINRFMWLHNYKYMNIG
jgi:predicted nuclease of predicted toxin-antitoxin system